ncbi:MAG: hypothetical protein ABIK28_13430 [Planctomycetota bacterium]
MNKIGNIIRYAGLLSLLLGLCVFPALAQDCGKTCSDKSCSQSCDKKAGSCPASDCSSCDKKACTQECPHSGAKLDMAQMAESMANCEICKSIFEEPELMAACDYSVAKFNNGLIFNLYMKDMSLMPQFKAHAEKDLVITEKYMAMSPEERGKRLCPICQHYFMFRDKGMKEERIMTPTGALTVLSTDNPELIKAVHGYGDMINDMVAGFDAMAPEGQAPCAASADGSAGACCSAKAECASASCCSKALPAEVMESMKNCRVCRVFCEQPEMLTAADSKIVYLKQGLLFCNTLKDMNKVKAYQNLEHRMIKEVEAMQTMPLDEAKGQICDVCKMFADLGAKGVAMDFSDTPTGTLSVITGVDESQIKSIL